MWGAFKWVLLLGTGVGVLVLLAMEFQPGKNAKGGLNMKGQPVADRFLTPEEVGPLGSRTRLEVHDSQCGYKAFRGDAGRLVFSLSEVDGFAMDPEVLMIARALGLTVTEVPVDWTAVEGSTVRPLRDSLVTGLALVRVVWQARPRRVRDRARALGWSPAARAEQS